MITPPIAPSPGKPVSAGFFARLIAWVKSGMLVEGPGYRLRRTPNGTSLDIHQVKAGKEDIKDNGRFKITISSEEKEENGEKKMTFKAKLSNLYFDVGGKTYKFTDDEKELSDIKAGNFIALKVQADGSAKGSETVEKYDDFDKLEQAQRDVKYFISPLYLISDKMDVECDFRIGPSIGMGEFG